MSLRWSNLFTAPFTRGGSPGQRPKPRFPEGLARDNILSYNMVDWIQISQTNQTLVESKRSTKLQITNCSKCAKLWSKTDLLIVLVKMGNARQPTRHCLHFFVPAKQMKYNSQCANSKSTANTEGEMLSTMSGADQWKFRICDNYCGNGYLQATTASR